MNYKTHSNKSPQSGAALAVSLIILLVLTLLVVSGTQDVVLQEKMTSAVRDANVSLAVSEAGIRDAEVFIESRTDLSDFKDNGDGGLYSLDNGPANYLASAAWNDGSKVRNAATTVSGLTAQYKVVDVDIINIAAEDLTGINMMGYGQTTGGGDVNLFQVVSRATGNSGNAERVVMSYYGKRF